MWFLTQMSITSRTWPKGTLRRCRGSNRSTREAAEITLGVADIGNGKLQIARPAMREDFMEQLGKAFLWFHHRGQNRGQFAAEAVSRAVVDKLFLYPLDVLRMFDSRRGGPFLPW